MSSYTVAAPGGGRLDVVDPTASAVQRVLRHRGLAGFEPVTLTTLLTLFERASADLVFFDVGANVGVYSTLCATLFDPVAVHAFEPTPASADMARRIAAVNGATVEVVEVALGAEDDIAPLYLSPVSDASNSMVSGFRNTTECVEVVVRRLDHHVEDHGVVPSVVKIDVETFEPHVLAGAAATIGRARPYIVIEVLYRQNRNLGEAIERAIEPFGYTYYPLSDDMDWTPSDTIHGVAGEHRSDWLLAPDPVTDDFVERWNEWRVAVAACRPELNSRMPISLAVRNAWHRGGMREIVATARRHVPRRPARSVPRELGRGVPRRRAMRLSRLRAVIDRIRGTWLAERATRLGTALQRRIRPAGRLDLLIERCLIDTPSSGHRRESADALVELFFDLVAMLEVDLFVEAGAKDAAASQRAADETDARVVAFEANPYTYRRFVASHEASAVEYENLALSDRTGSVDFLVRRDEEGRPRADGQGSLLVRPDHTDGYESVTVDGVRLDDFFAEVPETRSVALWIDVEGAVAPVLRGGQRLLRRTAVAMIEVETERRWDDQEWLLDDVVGACADAGCRVVARDRQARRQFNIVVVAEDLLDRADVEARLDRWRRGPGSDGGRTSS